VRARAVRRAAGVAAVVLALSACADDSSGNVDPHQVDAVGAPDVGACRVLTPEDAQQPSNATRTVDCSKKHTAETFAVGDLPDELQDASYDAPELGTFAYQTCSTKLEEFLGGDESTVMRTIVSWVWFRPSQKAWDKGARWYRCDVVGGGAQSKTYAALPTTAEGLLAQQSGDDDWMACVNGPSVQGAPRIPCSSKHNWRAVTTIKVGDPGDPYPGDKAVEAKTRDYCSSSVGAWLGYPPDYDFGYTWFHEAEWKAGNRRSVCWAATTA
jgi:Septum formation